MESTTHQDRRHRDQ